MLWGGLGEMLIEKRTRHVRLYPIILTTMFVKLYNNRIHLSSTSSTMIVDDEQIPVLKQFKSDDSGIQLAKELLPAVTFHCAMRIEKIRMKKGEITHHVVVRNVRRSISTASMAAFGVTHATVLWTTLYRLELEVSDDTAQAVVVMFDETARIVVKCSAGSIVRSEEQGEEETGLPPTLANIMGMVHTLELKSNSYYEHANYESFTCWSVILEEALDESGSSRTLAAAGGPKTGVFMPLTTTPSVTTPLKPCEEKKPRNEERHDFDGEESFVADSKTKGSDVGCSSEAGKRRRLVLDSSE
ncbi:reverse transcriptase domain-containing protein [Tanacetum coccineum]